MCDTLSGSRAEVIDIQNEHAAKLQARGVNPAALFGSKARGGDDKAKINILSTDIHEFH